MLNVPNAITLLRLALIAPLALLLLRAEYGAALALFVVAALSDLADGMIARRWNLSTRFGAVADPIADKLTMLVATALLALGQLLPWWFALALIARDVLIVGGVVAYHAMIGRIEMAPSKLSKLNTALEFLLLTWVLAVGAGIVEGGAWLQGLMLATLVTIATSGAQYVLVWSRRAIRARRASERMPSDRG